MGPLSTLKNFRVSGVILIFLFLILPDIVSPAAADGSRQVRIYVVSSYHKEYLWSKDTNEGLCAALLEAGLFKSSGQVNEYTRNDFLENPAMVIKKAWMDTKRKYAKDEIADAVERIIKDINAFKPDLIMLGDDNAANYIGNQFIDTDTPIVFWGINGLPLKYGLLESLEKPGHNVTGIYQAGYLKENIEYLKRLVPGIKTMAVLSDDSETGRAKAKEIEQLSMDKLLPVEIAEVVITNSFSEWKESAQRLKGRVDSFFVLNHNTLKDESGNPVDQMTAGRWYLENIKKPDCAHEKQFAQEGILLVVDDSGFKQGNEAMKTGLDIILQGRAPAGIPVKAPPRGPIIINRQRAEMLGLDTTTVDFIEQYIDRAMALEH